MFSHPHSAIFGRVTHRPVPRPPHLAALAAVVGRVDCRLVAGPAWLAALVVAVFGGVNRRPAIRRARLAGLAAAVAVSACSTPAAAPATTTPAPPASAPAADHGRKVLVIEEENHGYQEIIGSPDAPYLNRLATTYGTATNLDAGYPPKCPSLASYILMTSGTTDGICDDKAPKAHPLSGDNLFHQVAAAGREWRAYAEAAPQTCALKNQGRYLVRHVPATYYLDERADCARWTVPLDPALPRDLAAGVLPAFSFVTPDACNDMHGADGCTDGLVATGDRWLQAWLPRILAGPDYRAGRLLIVVTFDEGTSTDNHIPTIVIAPTIHQVSAGQPFTHCATLRMMEDRLSLPPLGCAASAASMTTAFGL